MEYKTIGNTVAQWDETNPLQFYLTDISNGVEKTDNYDLSKFDVGYEGDFLVHLRNEIINRRFKVSLKTIRNEFESISGLLKKTIEHQLFEIKVARIDEVYLLALRTIAVDCSESGLIVIKRYFLANAESPLFEKGLIEEYFPSHAHKRGRYGERIDRILANMLTRSASVQIIKLVDQFYEDRLIDIGIFSFIKLSFSIFCRPESYRQITVSDLDYNEKSKSYYLHVIPAKSRVHNPNKICYKIPEQVGVLLLEQRQNVIATYGHLIDQKFIGKLALFPARKMMNDRSRWVSDYANKSFGQLADNGHFTSAYLRYLRKRIGLLGDRLNSNSLRHAVATNLALLGCSAKTIQAVLKHAHDASSQVYVDIAFSGLINKLSDSMLPAFQEYFPIFSRFKSEKEIIPMNKAIRCDDVEAGKIILSGECGNQIRCAAAPFTCYECNKFIPCYDADHSVNLVIIEREIKKYSDAGYTYRQMVDKFKTVKAQIELVILACNQHKQSLIEKGFD